jgi:hypothetical protein
VQNKSTDIICASSRCRRVVSFTLLLRSLREHFRSDAGYSTTVEMRSLCVLAFKIHEFPFLISFHLEPGKYSSYSCKIRIWDGAPRNRSLIPGKSVQTPRTSLGPIPPPIEWTPGKLSLGVKRLRRKSNSSSISTAEVRNAWSCTSTYT